MSMHLSAYVIQQTPLLFKTVYAWVPVAYAQSRESWLIYIVLVSWNYEAEITFRARTRMREARNLGCKT